MLVEDATFAMPPHPRWFRGRESVVGFVAGAGRIPLRHRLIGANGQPAIAWYYLQRGRYVPASLEVLTLAGDRIGEIVAFASPRLFRHFGLPAQLGT